MLAKAATELEAGLCCVHPWQVHQALSVCRTQGLALSRQVSSASQLPV